MRIAFFDTKEYDRRSFKEVEDFEIQYFESKLNEETASLTKGFDAVCVFVNDQVNREVLKILKEGGVRLISTRSAGFNHIDLEAARELGLSVVRVPAYSPYAVAEHTVALMMTLNRMTHKSYIRTLQGNFSLKGLLGFDMHGKTAGLIGGGKIARIVSQILRGFGMRVLVYTPDPDNQAAEEYGFIYTDLNTLYSESDILSLHCPLTKETKYLINKDSISLMKKGIMIINTGRGGLVHTQDLIDGLKSEQVGYAGLDVYEEEGDVFFEDRSNDLLQDDLLARLLTFHNVLITSHQGFFTQEALDNIRETTLMNWREFKAKETLSHAV
jgi:D-lactate dehydrogenase